MSRVRVRVPGANDITSQQKILGAKIFYFSSDGKQQNTKTSWGKIVSLHGRTGVFLAKFKKQVAPAKLTSRVYIVTKSFIS